MTAIGILEILTFITTPLVIVLLFFTNLQKRRVDVLQKKLDEMQKEYFSLLHKYEDLESSQKEFSTFSEALKDSELTTALQKPRLSAQQTTTQPQNTQDKYQYIQSLSGSGMAADEIANVLSISSHEAEQLIKLSNLAKAS